MKQSCVSVWRVEQSLYDRYNWAFTSYFKVYTELLIVNIINARFRRTISDSFIYTNTKENTFHWDGLSARFECSCKYCQRDLNFRLKLVINMYATCI